MNEITLKNFRCFHEKQSARLAPLTLLVGENSTGKTSFLALVKALCDMVYSFLMPDFKEPPYDLGSFDEIVHHRRGRAESFDAGFSTEVRKSPSSWTYKYEVTFEKSGTAPTPVRRVRSFEDGWIEERYSTGDAYFFQVGTQNGTWKGLVPAESVVWFDIYDERMWAPALANRLLSGRLQEDEVVQIEPLNGSPELGQDDLISIRNLSMIDLEHFFREGRIFASAPVRSKPKRTYDPSRPTPDPEGDYVPMLLANLMSQDGEKWASIKSRLEKYGKAAGLFDEISIKRLGNRDSEPFQLQVRKFSGQRKGPPRNLIDVGYGVSQVLPVITELLRDDVSPMFLLQQPEVHLHPSAQAALGSLFCQIAGPERQLLVETHSDHLIDRVRMDVRDGVAALKPSDVSILFFERNDLDVKIHSLEIDEEGNIKGAPDGYRSFFMEETSRSLWKEYRSY